MSGTGKSILVRLFIQNLRRVTTNLLLILIVTPPTRLRNWFPEAGCETSSGEDPQAFHEPELRARRFRESSHEGGERYPKGHRGKRSEEAQGNEFAARARHPAMHQEANNLKGEAKDLCACFDMTLQFVTAVER
jgi:hypothetical protein